MEKLRHLLQELFPDIDFQKEESLIDDRILDSLDIVALVEDLNEAFEIKIGAKHLTPANFNSMSAMYAMIENLRS